VRRQHKAAAIAIFGVGSQRGVTDWCDQPLNGFAETSEHPACFAQKRITQMWLSKALYKVSAWTKLGLPTYSSPFFMEVPNHERTT
jgi:hypothetical protein